MKPTTDANKEFQQWLEKAWTDKSYVTLKSAAANLKSCDDLRATAKDMAETSGEDEMACTSILVAFCHVARLEAILQRTLKNYEKRLRLQN